MDWKTGSRKEHQPIKSTRDLFVFSDVSSIKKARDVSFTVARTVLILYTYKNNCTLLVEKEIQFDGRLFSLALQNTIENQQEFSFVSVYSDFVQNFSFPGCDHLSPSSNEDKNSYLPPLPLDLYPPQSSLFTVCVMADVEQQQIAVELRKFRKKLRQIEKLEELERDLTEEEVQKVTST